MKNRSTVADEKLPAEVRDLLDTSIDSVEGLAALMLIRGDAGRWWAVEDVARAIDVELGAARKALAELQSRGLAVEAAGASLFRAAHLTPLSLRAFSSLASEWESNRTDLIDYLARRSLARLRLLADAFTRRRGDPT